MGQKAAKKRQASPRCRKPASKKLRMHILPLAFLCVCLVRRPGCSSLPTDGDDVRKSVVSIARITAFHIDKLWAKLPLIPLIESSAPPIDGLCSISQQLGLLDNELQSPFTEALSQIQADISSLDGLVRNLAETMGCPMEAPPHGRASDNAFPHTHLYMTLVKVQRYVQQLLQNQDKLQVC